MKLTEMVKLSRAGYSPADIKELAEIAKVHPDALQLAENCKLTELKELISLEESEDQEASQEDPNPAVEKPDSGESDRAAALMRENEELKAAIQKIQESNARRDNSGNVQDPYVAAEEQVAAFIHSL